MRPLVGLMQSRCGDDISASLARVLKYVDGGGAERSYRVGSRDDADGCIRNGSKIRRMWCG